MYPVARTSGGDLCDVPALVMDARGWSHHRHICHRLLRVWSHPGYKNVRPLALTVTSCLVVWAMLLAERGRESSQHDVPPSFLNDQEILSAVRKGRQCSHVKGVIITLIQSDDKHGQHVIMFALQTFTCCRSQQVAGYSR